LYFVHRSWASTFFSHFFLQKSHKIRTNWSIYENIPIKPRIIITLKNFYVSHFRKISKRINVIHKQLNVHFVLQSFNNVNDIVQLVPNGQHVQKINQHASRIALNILNLVS
jgi:hypothetical protein